MSLTYSGSTATLTIEGYDNVNDLADAIVDYLGNNPEDIPAQFDEECDSTIAAQIVRSYLTLDGNNLTIKYNGEGNGYATDSDTFDFLSSHLCCLMSSPYMKVEWVVEDSKTGYSSGTDYYDKGNNQIDVDAAIAAYLNKPALIIDAQSGTILNAIHCYAIPAGVAQDDSLDEMSDSEVGDWAREHGTPVIPQAS